MRYDIIAILVAIITFAIGYGLSWVITIGIIKLITVCLGWEFSMLAATGIWLITCLLSMIFK